MKALALWAGMLLLVAVGLASWRQTEEAGAQPGQESSAALDERGPVDLAPREALVAPREVAKELDEDAAVDVTDGVTDVASIDVDALGAGFSKPSARTLRYAIDGGELEIARKQAVLDELLAQPVDPGDPEASLCHEIAIAKNRYLIAVRHRVIEALEEGRAIVVQNGTSLPRELESRLAYQHSRSSLEGGSLWPLLFDKFDDVDAPMADRESALLQLAHRFVEQFNALPAGERKQHMDENTVHTLYPRQQELGSYLIMDRDFHLVTARR